MTPITASAILFDMDGVLIDSTPAVERVWSGWAREHGFDPKDTVRRAHGRPSINTIRELLPNGDHEAENRIVEQREVDDVDGVVPLPGAMELLAALPPDRWAIATSCTIPLATVRIRAAGLPLPKFLITADDVQNGKPHPEPYLKAASKLGFAADKCIVIEDAPAGVRAGKDAGARVIALVTTSLESELASAGADWILNHCSEIVVQFTPSGFDGLQLLLKAHPKSAGQSGSIR